MKASPIIFLLCFFVGYQFELIGCDDLTTQISGNGDSEKTSPHLTEIDTKTKIANDTSLDKNKEVLKTSDSIIISPTPTSSSVTTVFVEKTTEQTITSTTSTSTLLQNTVIPIKHTTIGLASNTIYTDTDPSTTTITPNTTTTRPDTTTTSTTIPTTSTTTTTPTSTTTTPTSTTSTPTTTSPRSTTTTTTITPIPCHRFDGSSFVGGIVLTLGLMAIGLVAYKFFKTRNDRNYQTL